VNVDTFVRVIGADERDRQRLGFGIAVTVTDLRREIDLQYIACMQEIEIGIGG